MISVMSNMSSVKFLGFGTNAVTVDSGLRGRNIHSDAEKYSGLNCFGWQGNGCKRLLVYLSVVMRVVSVSSVSLSEFLCFVVGKDASPRATHQRSKYFLGYKIICIFFL